MVATKLNQSFVITFCRIVLVRPQLVIPATVLPAINLLSVPRLAAVRQTGWIKPHQIIAKFANVQHIERLVRTMIIEIAYRNVCAFAYDMLITGRIRKGSGIIAAIRSAEFS